VELKCFSCSCFLNFLTVSWSIFDAIEFFSIQNSNERPCRGILGPRNTCGQTVYLKFGYFNTCSVSVSVIWFHQLQRLNIKKALYCSFMGNDTHTEISPSWGWLTINYQLKLIRPAAPPPRSTHSAAEPKHTLLPQKGLELKSALLLFCSRCEAVEFIFCFLDAFFYAIQFLSIQTQIKARAEASWVPAASTWVGD